MVEDIVEGKMRIQGDVFATRKVPLEIERTKTNFRFALAMGIFLSLWLGIVIFAGVSTKFSLSYNLRSGITSQSLYEARRIIVGFIFLTTLMSFCYIVLLKHIAKVLVIATIFAFFLLLLAISLLSAFVFELVEVACIIVSVAFIPTIITLILLRQKIQDAIEVIRAGSKIVVSFPSFIFFPILPCALYGIVMILSLISCNNLLTLYSQNGCNYIFFFHFINIFGFLWLMLFITGWSQTVISGSFSTWYWTINKSYVTRYTTILKFISITIRYHLGTLACGSLLIMLCKLIKFLLNTFGRIYILFGCYKPLFAKLEKCIMYVNHNAYIMTGSHGTGFFKSGKDAANILTKNITSAVVITRVVEAILILGQLSIIAISALATYGYCQWSYTSHDPTAEALLMVILSGIVITASIFMVLKIAIDSIFLCILENEKKDSTTEKLFYVNTDIKALFLQSSRKI